MSTLRAWRLTVAVGLLLALAAPAAWADDPLHKMGRGVVNVLTGWIEMPKQMSLGGQEDNPVVGVGSGLARGLGLTLLRLGLGVYEAVTFPIPYPGHFESPYQPMGLSDYAWE